MLSVVTDIKRNRPYEKPETFWNHTNCDLCWITSGDLHNTDLGYICDECIKKIGYDNSIDNIIHSV